jgi:NAD-dependent SIR2 family protein deacetylase
MDASGDSSVESEFLHSMRRVLTAQGGQLDQTDVAQIASFLEQARARDILLGGDWSEIGSALNARPDPRTRRVLRELQSRLVGITIPKLVDKLALINGGQPRITFLVGAGASRSEPTAIPVVRDLLSILWEKAGEIRNTSLLRLRDQCKEIGIQNIEDLLTAITLAQATVGNPLIRQLVMRLIRGEEERRTNDAEAELYRINFQRSEQLRGKTSPVAGDTGIMDNLRDSTQTLFSVLVAMMVGRPLNAAHRTIAESCKELPENMIVTTNYDTCLEEAIGDDAYTYGEFMDTDRVPATNRRVPIVKLHGSLNWYSCLNCDRHVTAKPAEIADVFKRGLYPIVAICPHCQATSHQLIIPPIAQKYHDHPVMLDVRRVAEEAFTHADAIFVLGYSFTEIDEYVLRMISRAIQGDSAKMLVIFDVEGKPFERVVAFLQTHVRAYKTKDRIHPVWGDVGETLEATFAALREFRAGNADRAVAAPVEVP